MDARILAGSIVGAWAFAMALGAAAQTTGSQSAQTSAPADKPAATGTPAASSGAAKATKHKHPQHHAASKSASHGHDKHIASAPTAGSQDSAYRAALRGCVTGPATLRDSCVDSAIARYGRS